MILDFITFILVTVVGFIVKFIFDNTLDFGDLFERFADIFTEILKVCTQAGNFGYFMLGDTLYFALTSLFLILTYKYIFFPIITTLRHFFIIGAGK